MRCCHGNGLNPKIDYQKISLILTVPILVNLYMENFKRNNFREGVRKYSREPP